ncbi:helix-turn-helix domain-containing protein [Solimicrobium silvestre]|uniref:Helix-turn-helix domain n=1 Tax=Solimicrobium silvestre TaxID=2099400 RepID=A0A2S9GTH2_9BURK|nr:helix-turn-helix transcriptional regulator [Solimicrobium silvestre]PRC90988.1 Helix-turn-helix domain [Solimicrobium silvestre]
MIDFNVRLRAERKRLGLNQEKFAVLGGVTKDTQLNYESGSRKPDSDYLAAIARAGVDVLYLLTGELAVSALTQEENEVLIGYRSLDTRGKAGVLGLIDGMAPIEKTKKEELKKENLEIPVTPISGGNHFYGKVGEMTDVKGDQYNSGSKTINVGGDKKKKKSTPES